MFGLKVSQTVPSFADNNHSVITNDEQKASNNSQNDISLERFTKHQEHFYLSTATFSTNTEGKTGQLKTMLQ